MAKPEGTTPVSAFRINLKLKARLEKIAEAESRTLTYVVDKALAEFADDYERRKSREK